MGKILLGGSTKLFSESKKNSEYKKMIRTFDLSSGGYQFFKENDVSQEEQFWVVFRNTLCQRIEIDIERHYHLL